MRKIISILLALGMILALSIMATPVSAAVTAATVVPVDNCAGAPAQYTITFNITASLTEGFNKITIQFPAGTVIPTPVPDGAITVEGVAVFGSEVTVVGTTVTFIVPADIIPATANPIVVVFNKLTGPPAWAIVNPPTAGTYNVYVNTDRAPDATPVKSVDYPISPAVSAYTFMKDFGPTYPGIVPGFIPPFKAGVTTAFDLIFKTDGLPGCDVPCTNVTVTVALVTAPPGAKVSINGTSIELDLDPLTTTVLDVATIGVVVLDETLTVTWPSTILFNMVGDYVICFYADCGVPPVCTPGVGVIAEECDTYKAYQWLDAYQIDLLPKWNLISLPLFPFDTDIADVLASLNASSQFMSVWYYDRCLDAWSVYPGPLGTMEAGKGYWIRMMHPGDVGYNPALFPAGFWVFGTHAPMPPANPMGYFDVCDGWNMVGFKAPWIGAPLAPTTQANNLYLWNFNTGVMDTVHYGLIYDWVEASQDWTTIAPGGTVLTPGVGYWIPFDGDGEIYPSS